jgi:hypothetical protein
LHLSLIADLAGRYRLPSIVPNTNFAKNGGPERHSAIATSPTDVFGDFLMLSRPPEKLYVDARSSRLP